MPTFADKSQTEVLQKQPAFIEQSQNHTIQYSEIEEDSDMRKELRETLEQKEQLQKENETQVDKLRQANEAESQAKQRIGLLITAAADHSK